MGYNKERYRTLKMTAYYLLFGLWYLFSLLPLCIHYLFADFVAFLLHRVIKYRRYVVRANLESSYPHLPKKELRRIESGFYRHFSSVLMESFKFFTISKKNLMKRMQFKGLDLIADSCRRGKSCGVFLGHYANWEWVSSLPLWVDKEQAICAQLYHPLENLVTDLLISHTRSRTGGYNIPVNQSVRELVKLQKSGKPVILGFIADQAPFWRDIHYWSNFLNHPETPIFTGAERIMTKFDMDVYYLDVRRIKRGYYTAEFKLMTTTPKECAEFELTERYTRLLEETINAAPDYWLWSHKRWKRNKAGWQNFMNKK